MTVFVIEQSSSGHQPHYVKVCTKALISLGCNVVSVVPKSSAEYSSLADNEHHQVVDYPQFRTFSGRGGGLLTRLNRTLSELRLCKSLRTGKRIHDISKVYYPTMSGPSFRNCKFVYKALNYQWSGLYISASELRRGYPNSYHKDIIKGLFATTNLTHLFTNDSGVIDQLGELVCGQVGYFPEIVAHSNQLDCSNIPMEVVSMFEPVPGQIVITHAGLLTKRKGIMHFVRAIQTIKCPKVVFNIVGPVSLLDFTAEEASHIEQTWKADDRVRLYRKPVSSEVFQWMINRTDLVFAVYDEWTQGSSVLTHASHAGVPCIVPAGSCMADLCSMFNLGWVVDPTEVTDYSQVFEGFLESRDRDNFGFSDHLSFQSYSNVVSAMQRLIS